MQEWIQDFHLGGGGGGAKGYVSTRTLRARNHTSLSAGVKGPLKGQGNSRVVLIVCSDITLSRNLSLIFLSILIKNWIKNMLVVASVYVGMWLRRMIGYMIGE